MLQRQVCGTQDLKKLTEIHLKIMSSMVCIQRLDVFLPNLVALNLDGSMLNSLRDLGSYLQIKYLNVSRCGLNSLDGSSCFTKLVHLIADGNRIRNMAQVCSLIDLQKLSLRGFVQCCSTLHRIIMSFFGRNQIKDVATVSFLGLCNELKELDLAGNPVALVPDYRVNIRSVLPEIKILDDVPFYDEPPTEPEIISSSEYSSSLTSSLDRAPVGQSSGPSSGQSNFDLPSVEIDNNRPASSGGATKSVPILTDNRPSTAGNF